MAEEDRDVAPVRDGQHETGAGSQTTAGESMSEKEFSLSRRKALAGLGSIGAATALGGIGTYAQFTDTESVQASFGAGELNGVIDYAASYNGEEVASGENSDAGFDAEVTILSGHPGSQLVEFAERGSFDRIVLGGGETSPLGKVQLGEISEFVILNAQTTVTLIR